MIRMKNILGVIGIILLVIIIHSCDSDNNEAPDERDKFIGTWTGKLYFSRIPQEFSVTITISKSTTDSKQIVIKEQLSSSAIRTATVSGNSYIYKTYVFSAAISGNYSGGGSLEGTVLRESGKITSEGSPIQGDLGEWGRMLEKQ